MNKRKIVLLAVALVMVAILGMGSTLAYLTDTDNATNVFTVGNVDILLHEDFVENSKLLPGIDVNKDVRVQNVGSEAAFVRVHVAIPKLLDNGYATFASYANTLHWNFSKASVADGLWNWHSTNVNGSNASMPGWPGNGGAWNWYTANVDGIEYTVYVATYETALEPNETTKEDAITKVYLDASLDNVHIENIIAELGEIKILVAAEAVQAAGFNGDAYAAFNAAHKDANPDDGKDIVNLPTNLIEYIYASQADTKISADSNANDQ